MGKSYKCSAEELNDVFFLRVLQNKIKVGENGRGIREIGGREESFDGIIITLFSKDEAKGDKFYILTVEEVKAMKLIKSLFVAQANKNQIETGMIKNIPDTDMTNMLINNCRVLAPGLTKMQNQNKQNKRKKD